MRTHVIPIGGTTPGSEQALTVQRFGAEGARPLVHIQAALHADEIPGMIAAAALRARLTELEAAGAIRGEIALIPVANPIGLAQTLLGSDIGRFDLRDGVNFNRAHAWLTPGAIARLDGRLTADPQINVARVREALIAELDAAPTLTPTERLKQVLLRLALAADFVLDLHCDSEAVMHLYTLPETAGTFATLAARLGAQALLVAQESGGDPFDEASSRPWGEIAARFPDAPIPRGGASVTVELRGEADVDPEMAERDAAAIVGFLADVGAIVADVPPPPPALCAPTPLAASEPLVAPVSGIVAFRKRPGDAVTAGEIVVDILDPLTGARTLLRASADGLVFARASVRFAHPGRRLAKIAGVSLRRTGKLLSP